MSFSFSCSSTIPVGSARAARALIRRSTSSRCFAGAWSGRRKKEKIRMKGAPRRRATTRARSARTRWASKSSSMLILPSGEPIDETDRPWSARMAAADSTCSSVRSRTLVPQALRNSTWLMPRSFRVAHWVSRSGSISSAKPDRVHTSDRPALAEDGVLEFPLAVLGLVADLAEPLVGQRVGDEHDHGDERGGRRHQPEDDLDGGQRGGGLLGGGDRGGRRDVAAERQGPRRRDAADRLGELAGEGEDRVGRPLGPLAGLPLAVLDGVGLEREHQRVDEREPDALDAEAEQGEPDDAVRREVEPHTPDDGEEARVLEQGLLAEPADELRDERRDEDLHAGGQERHLERERRVTEDVGRVVE